MSTITFEERSVDEVVYLPELLEDRADPKRAAKIAEAFREEKMNPGTLWKRDEGDFVSLDGWHTDQAAKANNVPRRLYRVISGITYEDACAFYAQQHELERRQSPAKMFTLMAVAGRSPQKEILQIMQDALIAMKPTGGKGCLSTPSSVQKVYRRYGPTVLERTLKLLGIDWRSPGTITATLVIGASELFVRAPDLDYDTLIDALRIVSPMKVDSDAWAVYTKNVVKKGDGSNRSEKVGMHVAGMLADLYNEKADKKIIVRGQKADARAKKARAAKEDVAA